MVGGVGKIDFGVVFKGMCDDVVDFYLMKYWCDGVIEGIEVI